MIAKRIKTVAIVASTVFACGGIAWRLNRVALRQALGTPGRPLTIAVRPWPGVAPGLIANGGQFKTQPDSLYGRANLSVEFVELRGESGAGSTADISMSSIDVLARVLPQTQGPPDKAAFLYVDRSKGAYAMVARGGACGSETCKTTELHSVTYARPDAWFLYKTLEPLHTTIRRNEVRSSDYDEVIRAFEKERTDAIVLAEPELSQFLHSQERDAEAIIDDVNPESIADVLVSSRETLINSEEIVQKFVRGWLAGAYEAKQNPETAARALAACFPRFRNAYRAAINKVVIADLNSNITFFEPMNNSLTSHETFDSLFEKSTNFWLKAGLLPSGGMNPEGARDTRFVRGPVVHRVTDPCDPANPRIVTAEVHFETNESTLSTDATDAISRVALMAVSRPDAATCFIGYTDDTGPEKYNDQLGFRRAQAVQAEFVKKHNIDQSRTAVDSMGKNNPKISDLNDEARRQNRRVEILVVE